jgi:hypothetical protein
LKARNVEFRRMHGDTKQAKAVRGRRRNFEEARLFAKLCSDERLVASDAQREFVESPRFGGRRLQDVPHEPAKRT